VSSGAAPGQLERRTDPLLDPPPGAGSVALIRAAARMLPLPSEPPDARALRRILVVRTDERVGNALLTIPLALALRDLLPSAEVHLLLSSRVALVAEGLEGIRVLHWTKTDAFRRPLRFVGFLRDLRRAGFDAVIDAAHWHAFSVTSALLSRWAAHRWVVGADRGPARFAYSATVPPPPDGASELAAKLSLLGGIGLAAQARAHVLRTRLGEDLVVWAHSVLGGPAALLNPGARKADHRWPADRFAAVASALYERHGVRSIVAWGPGEEPLARSVVEASSGAAFLAPPTDLRQLAALLRACALAVTNDTGPMHLAAACGAPLVALLHADEGRRWIEEGPRCVALVHADVAAAVSACERLLDTVATARKPASSSQEAPFS
jgi:ADP-heptose:LPS heptosyltransferase